MPATALGAAHVSQIETPSTWRRRTSRTLATVDAFVVAASSALAYTYRTSLGEQGILQPFDDVWPAVVGVVPLWLVIFYFVGAYRPEYLNASADAFRRFVSGILVGVFALGFISFFFRLLIPRVYVALLAALVFVVSGGMRVVVRSGITRAHAEGRFTQGFLVVGVDEEAVAVARTLADDHVAGYEPRGFLTADLPVGAGVGGPAPVVGAPDDALDLARSLDAGLVLVAPGGLPPGTLRDVIIQLEGSEVDLAIAPSFVEVVSRRVLVEAVGNVPIMHVQQIRLTRGKAALKRTLDLVVAAVLSTLVLPVMAVAAVLVRLDSPGPVLFRQVRMGRDGEPFTILKLRTMRDGAEAELADLSEVAGDGGDDPFFKLEDDPRITRLGGRLRAWSLDEVPQLWNVLRGDMSMVGPRPLPGDASSLEPWQQRRLRVRPGLTGLWQVDGRSYEDSDTAIRTDLFYIENWSLGWDLLIILQTVGAVLTRRGAT